MRSFHCTMPARAPRRARGATAWAGRRVRPASIAAVAATLVAACGTPDKRPLATARAAATTPVAGVDDFGDTVRLPAVAPTRVVSLNPTTTELLFALGAGSRLVGRTHWDAYPDAARRVPDLGNGIGINVEAVLAARPDLVVLYAGVDNRQAARVFRDAGIAVVALKIDRVAHFASAARLLGRLVGDSARGVTVADTVLGTIARVRMATARLSRPRAVWPLSGDPLYVIGGGSFLSELLDVAGAENVFADSPQPSPQVSREEVLRRGADVVIAGPASVARLREGPEWQALAAVRAGRLVEVDTTMTLRPGVQLGQAAVMLAEQLHPGALAAAAHAAGRAGVDRQNGPR